MATVVISSELMEALENRIKAQAETIARLKAELAQCEHALDDEGEDGDICNCGHPRSNHDKEEGHACYFLESDGIFCKCYRYEAAK